MACTCTNCIYGEYKGPDERHLGAEEYDCYCHYWGKWVRLGGKCNQYA